MSTFVEQPLHEVRDNPDPDAPVVVLIGVESGGFDEVRDRIVEIGTVLEELPFDTLKAEIPETAVQDLENLPGVESIETDAKLTELSEGNS